MVGVYVGVGVESVGGPDGGECDGSVLASEDGPEVPYMPRESWCVQEGVGVGTDVEGHVDGVEDERHVQPGVGAAVGWEGGVVAGDVVGTRVGRRRRCGEGQEAGSWVAGRRRQVGGVADEGGSRVCVVADTLVAASGIVG